jgi:hypothetical protein
MFYKKEINRLYKKSKELSKKVGYCQDRIRELEDKIDKQQIQIGCKHENFDIEPETYTFWTDPRINYIKKCRGCGLILDCFLTERQALEAAREQAERDLEKAKRDKENATKEE